MTLAQWKRGDWGDFNLLYYLGERRVHYVGKTHEAPAGCALLVERADADLLTSRGARVLTRGASHKGREVVLLRLP